MTDAEFPILTVRGLSVRYPDRRRGTGGTVEAVRGVDLDLAAGEALGIVGESGSGKSSLVRALMGIVPSSGSIRLEGRDLAALRAAKPLAAARRMQLVFQDSSGALDPRQRVGAALREVLELHGRLEDAPEAAVGALLEQVGLDPAEHAPRFPHQLSGGQRQRIGIARALAVRPDVLLLDEPVSALDLSVQAQILVLLAELRRSLGLSLVVIAHDLAVVRNVCDRVAVMYRGKIVEIAPTDDLFANPLHPYTRTLLDAVPTLPRSDPAAAP
ncbi:ATP-binding cassette domain-containing protein [Gaopeijia maritima]|uniref:ATP-binding cassette domain-containing protein n=1 Tax=Gaopeijia maritima TaxID=3119007 RepID=UPI0032460802